ncbi:MAG: hypothetical protein ABFS34_00635 [Gemmatimonadota bacterium]
MTYVPRHAPPPAATLIALLTAVASALALPGAGGATPTAAGPTYDGDATREVVEAMLEAHGYERWTEAPSARFELIMNLLELPVQGERRYFHNWRRYDVTLDPRTSRGFVEMPFEEIEQPSVGFDGASVWAREYVIEPMFRDPPLNLLYMHSSIVQMPFLTQLDGARLEDGGTGTLPGQERELPVVSMTLSVGDGAVHFQLFIDPDTHLLEGFVHDAFYPPLPGGIPPTPFPGNVAGMRIARIVDVRQTVDGVVIPRTYYSIAEAPDGTLALNGTHLVLEASFAEPFDEGRSARPADARVVLTRR